MSENTHSLHNFGISVYSRPILDRPPPSTITCGSRILMTEASERASRLSYRVRLLAAGRSPDAARRAIGGQSGSRKKRFDAAAFAAVTAWPREFIRVGPWQRVVSPFARDRIRTFDDATVDHYTTSNAGSQDNAKDGFGVAGCAISCF